MFHLVFREMRHSVFSASLRKHFVTSKDTAVQTGLRFDLNGQARASTCQFPIEGEVLIQTILQRNPASGFGAWRNDCDRWEGILKLTREQPRELELTLGCRQESLVACSLVSRFLRGGKRKSGPPPAVKVQ